MQNILPSEQALRSVAKRAAQNRVGRRSSAFKGYLEIHGIVVSDPVHTRSGEKAVSVEEKTDGGSIFYQLKIPAAPWSTAAKIDRGAEVSLGAIVYPHAPASTPPNPFSYQGRLYLGSYAGSGYVRKLTKVRPAYRQGPLRFNLYRVLYRKHSHSPALGVVCAAALGMKSLVNKELAEVFRQLGIGHLLVVSGFHLGVVYAAAFLVFRLLMRRLLSRTALLLTPASAVSAGVLVWSYALLIDGSLSTYRALLAATVVVGSQLLCRRVARRRALGLAVFICILFSPGAFFSAGMQLTFAALAGLWTGSRAGVLLNVDGWLGRIVCSVVMCFSAWLFTAPVVLMHFGYLAPIAPIVNVVAAPIFSAIVIAGGLGSILLTASHIPYMNLPINIVLFAAEVLLDLLYALSEEVETTILAPQRAPEQFQSVIAACLLLICAALWCAASYFPVRAPAQCAKY